MSSCEIIEGITLHHGDCRDIMRALPADHFDAIITDPPYGTAFKGEKWDTATPRGFQAWCESWATEALRILKPGGYLLACCAPRTYHRLTAGIEDAGFAIRDAMAWIRADGKPSGVDLMVSDAALAAAVDQGAPDNGCPVFRYQPKVPTHERPKVGGVQHATVKPLELMRYLIRLVVRPGALIFEPVAGSGTTLQAAAMEGVSAVGCELDKRYIPLIHERFRCGIDAPLNILI